MKKQVIIGIIAVVVIVLVGVVAFFVFGGNNAEFRKLEAEVEYFIANGYAKSELATRGELIEVEKLIKEDFKKIEIVTKNIDEVVIEDFLTPENYAEDDDSNFVGSKLKLNRIKAEINSDIDELRQIGVYEVDLSDYCKEKYGELLKKSNMGQLIANLENDKQVIEEKVEKAKSIFDYLARSENKWEVVNNEFKTLDDQFKTEYEKLINEFNLIGK